MAEFENGESLSARKSDIVEALYKSIPWDVVVRNEVIRLRDHQVIIRSHDNLEVVVDNAEDSLELGRILLKLSDSPHDIRLVKYGFLRAEQILGLTPDGNDAYGIKHASMFTFGGVYINDHTLIKGLLCPDVEVQRSAALVFAALLNVYEGDAKRLLDWVTAKLVSSTDGAWEVALPVLSMYVKSSAHKAGLIEAGVVENVASVLRAIDLRGKTQQVYELVFVLWTLALGAEDSAVFLSAGLIPLLVELLSVAPTRKIVRMVLALLSILAAPEDDATLNEMLTANLVRVLDTMKHNNFLKGGEDEDVEADFKNLYEVLARNYRELSSYDRWASQVGTGALRWGVVHTEKFWRENAKLLEEDGFKTLRKLIELLKSANPEIASVALYDVGEFARFYPNGRVILSRLGAKDQVMLMMESGGNAEVQRHTLQCISKLMVSNWEFLR
ncbi:armadillo-type protein [Ochromonadaceae sp. CCMP2298]|nr:armadillo-type protein [Ochromonadaceae sp. CCMP2298]